MNKYHLVIFILLFSISGLVNAQLQPGKVSLDNFDYLQQSPASLNNTYLERESAWPYGSSIAVAVDSLRDLIFLGSGGAVLVLDGFDKNNLTLITDDIRTQGLVEDIFYDDQQQRLYLACGEGGFEIWDVQIPNQPENMSRMEILYFGVETPVGHVQVTGNYAILECNFGYVHSVDVGDPYNPVQVAFNGTMGNPAHNIHLGTDGRIHTTGAQYYIRFNIGSDGSLNSAGGKEFIYGAGAVFGKEEIAFVGYSGYMYILDLLLPGFPAWSITDVGGIGHLEVRENYAYIINNDGFYVWDVSNVQNPALQYSYPSAFSFDDLYVAGNYAYLGAGPAGLRIFDISNPVNPVPLGTFDTYSVGLGLYVDDNIAYLADAEDGLLIIDKSNLDYPELIGQYSIPNGFCYQVEVRSNIAYTVCWTSGFRIVDVTNPSSPFELAVDSSYDVWKLDLAGNYAYVVEAIANAESYLHIYDISIPSSPAEVSSTQFPTTVYEVLYDEGYLYVANEDNGLRILDVSNPANPVEVASLNYPDAFDVDILGNILYVCAPGIAQPDGGFYTVDISNPQNPIELDMYDDPGFTCFTVKVEGNYAYITDGNDIHLIDISNPSNLLYLEEYRMPDFAYDTHPQNGLVYVSDAQAGLQILNNTQIIPVELTLFTAEVNNNSVKLSWKTATETNNTGFEIQRKNIEWEKIGFVEGHGTTTEENNYSFVDESLSSKKYQYRLKQIDFDGSFEYSETVNVHVQLPTEYTLSQNFPNPFNPNTTINFSIPEENTFVSLKIFNSIGQEIETLIKQEMTAGYQEVQFNAIGLTSGVYFYKLQAGDFIQTKKMILMK